MENYTLHDYIAILNRRKIEFFATAGVLMVIAAIFAATWSTYRTTATIQIQAPDIPEGMTVPLGVNAANFMEALADQRIQQIQQKVTATTTLVEIITKFNLYADARQNTPITDIVEAMRKKIKLELVSTELSNPATASRMSPGQLAAIAFRITFKYNDPLVTQQVTDELVSRFLDEDLKQRRTKARETSAFLGNQIEMIERAMAEQERKIADFRREHAHSRPEALTFNQQMAATTGVNLQDVDRQLSALEQSRGALRAQIATVDPYSRVIADGQVLTTPAIQLKALQARYSTMLGTYGTSHPDVVKLGRQIEALRAEVGDSAEGDSLPAQIADARTNLAAAERTYGTGHPDVVALRSKLTALERQAALPRSGGTAGILKKDADNPAYLMLVSQLQAADSQYQALSAQRDSLRQQREHYERLVAETPMVEQEYATLARDYDNSQLRYRELKEKKLAADMNEQMEQGRKAERLVVIESAELPTRTSPARPALLAAGVFLSLFGGMGGVVAAELMSRSIHGPRHLATLAGEVPPLVVIPRIRTIAERERARRLKLRGAVATGAALALLTVVIDQTVIPLDVVWSMVVNRLGLS